MGLEMNEDKIKYNKVAKVVIRYNFYIEMANKAWQHLLSGRRGVFTNSTIPLDQSTQ